MSSTTITSRPVTSQSRSLVILTPDRPAPGVAGDSHDLDFGEQVELAHEVGHEAERAPQHADEDEVTATVVGGDFTAQFGHALPYLTCREQHAVYAVHVGL